MKSRSTPPYVLFSFLLILMILLPTVKNVSAQYFPPLPPAHIIVRETHIFISYTVPQKVVTVDVTAVDPMQVVRKVVLTLKEPVLSISFIIYHLKEKPPDVPYPPDAPLLYFTIRAHEDLLKNIEKAVILFCIERKIIQEKEVDVKTIVLNGFFENRWERLPTVKVSENEKYVCFEAESPYLSHFVATGVVVKPFPWWIIMMVTIIALILVAVGAYYITKKKIAREKRREE